jgi:hypothetical protein
MMGWILMGLLALGAAAQAAEAAASPLSPSAEESLKLTGRWGLGFDSIPGASSGTGQIPGFSVSNAVSLRYWINEQFCWDGLLAVNLSSQPSGGIGASGVPAGTDQRAWGFGTVMKYNLKRPSRWLLAQVLGRASLASLQQLSNNGGGNGQTTSTLGLGVGLGFEAFLPLWDNLSVEGSVLANFSSSQTKPEGSGQAAQSGSSLSIDSGGFNPLNVGIHLYF